ncbi:PH domain-containing protein [Corynebacterium appendicis CIP 107643]|uniref:PH domain-containing protein n=1 Tax=Corynebacterium appendicis CIP 107643 TaxID=1161099 RepID=A0A1N7IUD1_9CORY|nr:PH domain-containing protein [Corynebacterium appendicis]WJY60958.1 Low molecular weight protein antigen 6 [Corynebacterium appendicis CIP 107643]SIS40626.1 PH domain-containing protein [Corynebacterium appendicis CIP 107643]
MTFTPDRTHIFAAVLMAGIALIGISWAPLKLGWLLIFPIIFIVWVLTAKTRVDDSGIAVSYLFKKNVHLPWDQLRGIGFEGSSAKVATVDGQEYTLPGVTFNSLPDLAEASSGRIADVITQASEAADGMMEVTDQEGNSILVTPEEYEERTAAGEKLSMPGEGDNEGSYKNSKEDEE